MESVFDIIVWLLVMYFIFGGSKKKKVRRSIPPKQSSRQMSRKEPEAKPVPAKTATEKTVKPDSQHEVKVYTSLGDFVRDMAQDFRTVLGEEKAKSTRPQEAERRLHRRKNAAKPQPKLVDECDYCTGEIEPGSVFTERVSTATPKAVDDAAPVKTVDTVCRELGLNPMQQAFVWKEILDEPVALRK